MVRHTGADLLTLQASIKADPQGYVDEFQLQYRHYRACLGVFALRPTQHDEEFLELVGFLAQVSHCYPEATAELVADLVGLLEGSADLLAPPLRLGLVKALVLLRHRGQATPLQLLPLFFRLFSVKDKALRALCFKHIVADIKGANKRAPNEALNRPLQAFLYSMLADGGNVTAAKKSLAVLSEMYRRNVWRDAKTVNVLASAVFHRDTSVMLAAVKFFLGQDQHDDEGSDAENDDEDDGKPTAPTKEDIYRAYKKGTVSSKKKKQAKLKRVMHTVKKASRQQGGEGRARESFAALQLLHDPQGFCERLFTRVQSASVRYETRLLLLTLLSRVAGMHRCMLLNLFPYLQKYIQPHQRDVTTVLAALVQATHDQVPPEVLEPVLRQLCDQFIHDTARPEAMTVGLKSCRELCLRCPLVMNPDLLQDLVGYKKFKNKAVSSAARGLMGLFREIAPGMLEKRDRGRGADLSAAPQEFGASRIATRIEGAELLQEAEANGEYRSDMEEDDNDEGDEDEGESDGGGEDAEFASMASSDNEEVGGEEEDEDEEGGLSGDKEGGLSGDEPGEEEEEEQEDGVEAASGAEGGEGEEGEEEGMRQRRSSGKSAGTPQEQQPGSLSALRKQLAAAQSAEERQAKEEEDAMPIEYGRILTEQDFERIRELRHRKLVDTAMAKHGLKATTSHRRDRLLAQAEEDAEATMELRDGLGTITEARVTGDNLRANIKTRRDKAERMESVLKGREGREEFGAAAKRKKKKAGGTSNREKDKRKNLPGVAKMAQIRKRTTAKKGGAKNFRGRVLHRFRGS